MKHKKYSSVVLDYLFVPPATIVMYVKPGTSELIKREQKLIEFMTNSTVFFAGTPQGEHNK